MPRTISGYYKTSSGRHSRTFAELTPAAYPPWTVCPYQVDPPTIGWSAMSPDGCDWPIRPQSHHIVTTLTALPEFFSKVSSACFWSHPLSELLRYLLNCLIFISRSSIFTTKRESKPHSWVLLNLFLWTIYKISHTHFLVSCLTVKADTLVISPAILLTPVSLFTYAELPNHRFRSWGWGDHTCWIIPSTSKIKYLRIYIARHIFNVFIIFIYVTEHVSYFHFRFLHF